MAKATLPDGRVLEFPNSMSDAEIRNQIRTMYSQPEAAAQPQSILDPRDLGAGELFKGAAKRSLGSLASGVTDVLPAMGASALGYDEYAKEQMGEHEAKLAELEAEHPTAYRSYKDVQGLGDVPGYLAEAVGEQVPTMGAMLTGSGAGALGARALMGEAAIGAGAKAGLGAASGAMNIPDTFDQIYQDTGSMKPGLSLAVGSVVSWLDTALPKQLVDQLGGNGMKVLATRLMDKSTVVPHMWKKEFTKEMVKDISMEGLTEGAQQAIQNLGSSIADPSHEFFSQENIDRIIDSAIKGSVGGGAMGAPSSAIQALHTKAAAQRGVDEQFTPQVEEPTGQVVPGSVEPTEQTIPGVTQEQIKAAADEVAGPTEEPTIELPTQETVAPAIEPTVTPTITPTEESVVQPSVQEVTTEEPTQAAPTHIISADALNTTGLSDLSPLHAKIADKDLTDPTQLAEVTAAVKKVKKNEKIPKETKVAVDTLFKQAREAAVLNLTEPTTPDGGGSGRPVSGDATGGAGVSTTVPIQPTGEEVTGGAGIPDETRLGTSEQPTTQPTAGAEVPSSPLAGLQAQAKEQANRGDWSNYFKTLDEIGKYRAGIEEDLRKSPITAKPEQAEPTAAPETEAAAPPLPEIAEPTNEEDYGKVAELLKTTPKKDPDAKAAKTYFGKPHEGLLAHLQNIAHDIAFKSPKFKTGAENSVEAAYFSGMRKDNAIKAVNWIRNNLSPETNRMLDAVLQQREAMANKVAVNEQSRRRVDDIRTKAAREAKKEKEAYRYEETNEERAILSKKNKEQIQKNLKEGKAKKEAEARGDLTQEQFEDTLEFLKRLSFEHKGYNLPRGVSSAMASPLHPGIVSMLRNNNLVGALRSLAGYAHPLVSRIAAKFARLSPTTKVAISDNLLDEQGRPVAGYFDPKTNTVHLDSEAGLSPHVLLHEVGHSLLSAEIDKPGSILARQLQQLFDKIKDSFPHAYGATNVHEFASEAWSNPEFAGLLQSINPDGSPHSAWDRFSRAVINFFRKMFGVEPKPLTSAYDVLDSILSDMVAPAPEYRNAGALYAPRNQASAMDAIDSTIRDYTPGLNDQQKAALSNSLKRSTSMVKSAIFALLPMHALAEVADTVFPGMGTRINNLINERSGYENTLTQGIDTIVNMAKHAIKTAGAFQGAFDNVVHDSTIEGVDPTKPRSVYNADKDKLAAWDNLNKRYNQLPKVWQQLYVTMRDGYKGMYKELEKAISSRLDDTNLDGSTKAKIKKDIFDKLTAKELIDPYFALGREGDLWLAFNHNGERYVEAFKSEYERNQRIDEVNANGATNVEPYSNVTEINFRNAPPNSFVNGVLKLMEINKVPDDAIQEMMRLFMSTLPETAMAKSLQKRKRTLGYKSDSIGVFERKSRNMAHQIANMVYNPKLTAAVDQMQQYTVMVGKGISAGQIDAFGNAATKDIPARDNKLEVQYLNEFKKHIAYVKSPTKHDLGSILTSTAFTYTLGFNLSSAIVNMANVPMIVAPFLKGQYGSASVSGALGNASRIFLGSPRTTKMPILGGDGKMHLMNVMPSIMNYAPDSEVGRRYATLVKIAGERGQLNRSQLYELLNGDTRTGFLSKVNAASGWAFHHGERMNREVTMMATYDLELQKLQSKIASGAMTLKEAQEHAANQAVYTAELTNGGIAAAAAPRIAQNALGKMLFMYKRYGVSMYYMLFKTFKEATQNADPDVRKAAWQQLGGIFGMSALMAGVQGIPMYGLASMVYSMFCDEDDDDLDTVTRKALGEFAYKGPLEYMTGLSIAGRITLNDLVFRDIKGGGGSQTFTQQMLAGIGGPVFGVADKIQRGMSKINEGHIERGIEDILPSALSNPLKAYRYATEGANTLRGDPITGDISAWNVAAQAFGFAPAEYTRQLEQNADIKGKEQYALTTATKLRSKYALAKRMGDNEGANEYKQKLLELGHKHPGLKINPRTINEALAKTLKGSKQASQESRHGVRYAKKMLGEVRKEEDEWENGYR